MKLKQRIYRELDEAARRGDFDAGGSLVELDAADLADGIAAAWDGRNRGRLIMIPGDSRYEARDLETHVRSWIADRRR